MLQIEGCYLTFLVRNIPSRFNESAFIGACLYNIGTLAIIILVSRFEIAYLPDAELMCVVRRDAQIILYAAGSLSPGVSLLVTALSLCYGIISTTGARLAPDWRRDSGAEQTCSDSLRVEAARDQIRREAPPSHRALRSLDSQRVGSHLIWRRKPPR